LPYAFPLRERGWEVTYLTPEGPEVSRASAHGYRWLPTRFTRRIDPIGDAVASADLLRTLVRERFDIIHTHNFKVSLIGRVLAGMVRAPVIVHTIHGITWSLDSPEPMRTANAMLERIASAPADLILAQSQADHDAFVEMHVVPRTKIRIIGNGVDLGRFDPARVDPTARRRLRASWGVEDDAVVVIFAGRMVREKGLEEVFEAASLLDAEGVRVAVAGRDDAERGDAPSATSLEQAKRGGVIFLGERRDMPEVFHAADIVGLASWREGMPRVLIEGAAMGRPLLATDIRGCREVVRPGVTGLLVELRSARAIADGLRRLARDPSLRQRMGAAARRDALARFDLNEAVRKVTKAYDDLVKERGLA
jgi:glycosyltransferase involved in cell wall biosynthesis